MIGIIATLLICAAAYVSPTLALAEIPWWAWILLLTMVAFD